ncbi:MAG TPA: alpha/beta hydrolase [Burkholderiales bacterium]|nr:alpha/beta hydrolase [Burkholderiales bacterium]
MDRTITPNNNTVVLHLIHGTWSDGREWVKEGSPFRQFLETKFGANLRVNSISWSGRNLDADRRRAKADVAQAVKRFQISGARQFLVGHSHGGNVAVYAASDAEISGLLCGVVCLSTPFISILPREFIRRAIAFAALLAFGPLCLAVDWLWQAAFGQSNGPVRLAITIVSVLLAGRFYTPLTRWLAKRSRQAGDQSRLPRADSVKVLALTSGEDEALSGLALLESISSAFRLLQHPVVVLIAAAVCMILLGVTDVLRSPLIPGSESWIVSEAWTYVTLGVFVFALLEAVATMVCWRIGLGLAWRDFPFGSSFFSRAMLTPVPLNFSRVEFRSLELNGTSLLAHCRIYTDDVSQTAVASWIEKQTASPTSAVAGEPCG